MIYYRVICVVAGFLHSLINSRLHLPFPENKLRLREMIRDQLKAVFVADGIRQCLHSAEESSQLCPQEVSAETVSLTCGVCKREAKEKPEGGGTGPNPQSWGFNDVATSLM